MLLQIANTSVMEHQRNDTVDTHKLLHLCNNIVANSVGACAIGRP